MRTNHRFTCCGIVAALLFGTPLYGQAPIGHAKSAESVDPQRQQIQQTIRELRKTVAGLNEQLQRLESLLKNSRPPSRLLEVWAMDSDGGKARRVASIPNFPIINSPEVSPDGRFIAVDGWKVNETLTAARLLVIDLNNGDVGDLGPGAMPNWSPDGKWLAFCKYSDERGVYIRTLDGETVRHIDRQGWGIQWSPDGLKLAYARGNKFVVHNLVSDSSREIAPADWNYTQIYWNPTWSPDSKEICFKARNEKSDTEFAIVNVAADVPTVRRRISAKGFLEDIAWHPDGTRILIPKAPSTGVNGQIYEFDPTKDDAPHPLAGQPTDRNNAGICWSRDGKTLFFISMDAALTVTRTIQ